MFAKMELSLNIHRQEKGDVDSQKAFLLTGKMRTKETVTLFNFFTSATGVCLVLSMVDGLSCLAGWAGSFHHNRGAIPKMKFC